MKFLDGKSQKLQYQNLGRCNLFCNNRLQRSLASEIDQVSLWYSILLVRLTVLVILVSAAFVVIDVLTCDFYQFQFVLVRIWCECVYDILRQLVKRITLGSARSLVHLSGFICVSA